MLHLVYCNTSVFTPKAPIFKVKVFYTEIKNNGTQNTDTEDNDY